MSRRKGDVRSEGQKATPVVLPVMGGRKKNNKTNNSHNWWNSNYVFGTILMLVGVGILWLNLSEDTIASIQSKFVVR